MQFHLCRHRFLGAAMLLAACSNDPRPAGGEKTAAPADGAVPAAVVIPDRLAPFGDGYPNPGDPCRRLGESAATSNWLDDSAMLVGCPTAESAAAVGGNTVAIVDGVRVISIPQGDANVGLPGAVSTTPPLSDP